jgi:hypothetical protein
MARSASTDDRTEEIIGLLSSDRCKALMKLYVKRNGAWLHVDDLDTASGIRINKSAKKYAYANYNLTPVTSTISFQVVNEQGKYSEGSGDTMAGLFDLDTEVQVRGGYLLDTETDISYNVPFASGGTLTLYLYRTEVFGGYIRTTPTNLITDDYLQNYFDVYYDTVPYGSTTYTPAAYVLFKKELTDDPSEIESLTSFVITCNTTKGNILYKTTETDDPLLPWTSAGATVNGTKTVTLSGNNNLLYVAIIFDGISWSDDIRVTALTINYRSKYEELYKENFYLDSPSFNEPRAPGIPRVSCDGRDIYKRAIETDINIADLSSGVYVDALVKSICDNIGIQYNSTSIADLTGFGKRTLKNGYNAGVKAEELFADIMQIVNKGTSRYQMYLEYDSVLDANILFIQPFVPDYDVSFVFDFRNYNSLGDKRKNYDKLLKRMTVLNEDRIPNEEVQLDTDTVNGAGTLTLSWSGNAENKRITTSGVGSATITTVTPTSIIITYTGATALVITAYGTKWQGKIGDLQFIGGTAQTDLNDGRFTGKYTGGVNANYAVKITTAGTPDKFKVSTNGGVSFPGAEISISGNEQLVANGINVTFNATTGHTLNSQWRTSIALDPPMAEGEFLDFDNYKTNRGQTFKEINPLVLSTSEASSIAESFITRYAEPVNEARSIEYPFLNLLLEQNDRVLLWSRFVFLTNIYYNTGMSYFWSQVKDSSSFTCEDSGLDFSDTGSFLYDRFYSFGDSFSLKYDIGYLYDMQDGPTATSDATDYSYLAPIRFTVI